MRPVEYIWSVIKDQINKGNSGKESQVYILSEEFKKEFTKKYKYDNLQHEINKVYNEINRFGRVLKNNYFECVGGNDGDLQYYYQCQECGDITQVDHSSSDCTNYDLHCATCNDISADKAVFQTHKLGSLHWVILMEMCEHQDNWRLENPDEPDYISGSVLNCKFRITKWMRFKIRVVTTYYRFIMLFEPIYNFKEWKKKKEAKEKWLADLEV